MMYVSYVENGSNLLLAVVIDESVLEKLRRIKELFEPVMKNSPYPANCEFVFPTKDARLIEPSEFDELIEDKYEYPDWAKGGEDPLEYYRFQYHNYVPKEDYKYADDIDSLNLIYAGGNAFGFNAVNKGVHYYGYVFGWSEF